MRYWESQEEEERKAIEACVNCGEKGHDKKSCPHELCLACGALDQHSTRECIQGVNCFRCGGRGHKSQECTQPRRGAVGGRWNGWAKECIHCGSVNHAETICPNLFRIYWYNDQESHEQARMEKWKEFGASQARGKSTLSKRKYRDDYDYRSSEESSTSEDDEEDETGSTSSLVRKGPPNDWDPAQKCCYNCAGRGHWGDDCPVPRCNPLRATGDPSIYSDLLANSGPFGGRYANSRREMRRQTEDQNLVSIIEDHSGSFDRGSRGDNIRFDALDADDLFSRRPTKPEPSKNSHGGRFSRKNRDKKSDLQDRISDIASFSSTKKSRKKEKKRKMKKQKKV